MIDKQEMVNTLNEIGYIYDDEEVAVEDFEEFSDEVETKRQMPTGGFEPSSHTVRMGRIHLENGDAVEMRLANIHSMIEHAEKNQK